MKKFLKSHRHLLALFAIVMIAVAVTMLGAPASAALAVIGCFQIQQFAQSKRSGVCYNTVLTPEQVKEFQGIMDGFKQYGEMFPKLKDMFGEGGGFAAIKKLPETLKELNEENDKLRTEIKNLTKRILAGNTGTGVRWVDNVPFVTDECARAIAGIFITCCVRQNKTSGAFFKGDTSIERALDMSAEALGITKAALTSSDIPLPTLYMPQVVELVWKYGQARQNCTIMPMGAGTVNLPRLKVGEDEFGIIAQSASVTEKNVGAENVEFAAAKVGGIVRIPAEIEEDTFIALGQFIARYISRRFAHYEDKMNFLGDGTAPYNSSYGAFIYAATQTAGACLEQLATGNTKPSQAALDNFRNMRGKVNAAALASSKYYMNPTMDALLCKFNTSATVTPYRREGQNASLDGYPIVWVGAMQPYTTAAAAGKCIAGFGDLSYQYMGERNQPRVETSREVYFATDEIGIRAIERIDTNPMAVDAASALLTAAS